MSASTWQLVLQASWLVKVILTILAFFSTVSWAIIFHKWWMLATSSRQSAAFQSAFSTKTSAAQLLRTAQSLPNGSASRVFQTAYQTRASSSLASERLLREAVDLEVERLQAYLPFLATTGSAAPFIGLLGTVWGIMDAFHGIGVAGSASLAVVAPAIAEALIATAAGLLAAIPAVVAYNAFINWTRRISLELEHFADSLKERMEEQSNHEARLSARTSV